VEDMAVAGAPVIGAMSRVKDESAPTSLWASIWEWLGFNELFGKRATAE